MTITTKYKTYTKMKPSGIEWLGDIPETWVSKRLKYISNSRVSNVDKKSEDDIEVKLCNYIDVYKNEYIDQNIDFMEATAKSNQIDNFELRPGDVIITKDSETPDDIGIPAYVKLENIENIVCGYHLAISTPKKSILLGKFLFRLFQSNLFRSYFEVNSNGVTRFGLDTYSIFNANILLPSIPEQHTIAVFLDRETAKIDDVVRKKQKLIDLLKEKRLALISNAITKGLDPCVKLKPSGIDWLGDIPETWEVKRLRFLCNGNFQYGANEEASDDNPENPRYIRITDIKDDGDLYEETFRSLAPEIANRYLLKDGDILFARSGATVGKTFRYKTSWGKCCYAGYLIKMTPNQRKISSEFLYYFVQSNNYIEWKDSIYWQATIQNISAEKYKNFIVCFPILEIQKEIVNFLDRETMKIDNISKRVESQIEKLQEYRQALITSAVTGKIMVT